MFRIRFIPAALAAVALVSGSMMAPDTARAGGPGLARGPRPVLGRVGGV